MVNVCQLPMNIFNQIVFGSGFYLYTITEAQWYIFRNIQTIYKKWHVPYTHFTGSNSKAVVDV